MAPRAPLTLLIGGLGFMVEEYAARVRARLPEIRVLPYPVLVEREGASPPEGIEDVDVVASFNAYPVALPRARHLKWFHVLMTGYDHILRSGLIPPGVTVTTSAGAVSIPIAEAVMGYLLFGVKKFRASLENQRHHKHDRMLGQMRELHGRTIGILGLGHIGRAVAEKAKRGFGMTVLGYRRSGGRCRYVDRVYGRDGLDELLRASDFLILALPHTPETENLIGERELRLLKPSAYVVNVARGEILNKAAFTRALKERWIAGGAIDVFWGDPIAATLAPDDELWDLENLLITDHNTTGTDRYVERTSELLCDNLERFLEGKRLKNVVTAR
ncbi:MAG: D-2-hydroxyacid dehydrogenase [Deltaproteobacteria bacterium]|nr:D-2-hydroxyacid dehydrogenase [Deltaproteobacteria bacterium]